PCGRSGRSPSQPRPGARSRPAAPARRSAHAASQSSSRHVPQSPPHGPGQRSPPGRAVSMPPAIQAKERIAMVSTAADRKVAPGHAAIEVLKANGVEVVFGLNGDHVLRLYDGLADLGGIEHVTVKHENNAALAAEAYGRLTGRPGV